jgi:hypothetical protein
MTKNTARNQDDLGRILDSCLELIANGSTTVEAVIDQYPQYSEQLRPPLEAAMWLQSRKEVFNPRPGFVQLSQRRLVNRFRDQGAAGGAGETFSRIPAFFQERRIAVQYSALLTLTAVLLFVGYRSTDFLVQRSIPGDPLYETKISREELQATLASNQEDETRLRIEFAQRRVIEMQELVLVGRTELIDKTLKNFEYQLSQAASGILAVAKTDQLVAAQLSSLFEETLRVPVNNFVGIIDTRPEFASGEFIDKFLTMASEPFEERPFEFVLVAAASTPTTTATFTATPTQYVTATFTATSIPASTATPSPTSVLVPIITTQPEESAPPPVVPTATNTSAPKPQPTDTPITPPTSAPPPTDPPQPTLQPTSTPQPTATNEPAATPTPRKTKKPKPTQHPTYRPTETN